MVNMNFDAKLINKLKKIEKRGEKVFVNVFFCIKSIPNYIKVVFEGFL